MRPPNARLIVVLALGLGAGLAAPASPAAPPFAQAQTAARPQTLNARDTIPFDAAVRTAALPNGLTLFIRHNDRPARRVLLRLAVKAGSINEADDQQGLAHLIEHMAFNGSAHFKAGELVSYFESIGARLGPHVNAATGFDQTVYMLEVPTDKPEAVAKGLTALADFAGGLTLDPGEVDKERGVVIEEWRLGLGANSRIRDKQLPVLFNRSRYAERLPIGKPEIIRTAPPARLRAFYDTWYRPSSMAVVVVGDVDAGAIERDVRALFGPLAARAPAAPEPNRSVPLAKELLVNVATDPEVAQSTVSIQSRRARESGQRVADYRRALLERVVGQIISDRFTELGRSSTARFLGATAGGGTLSRAVSTFTLRATVPNGNIQDGLSALVVEAKRVSEFGFGEGELDRAKKSTAAFFERAYSERDKTESGSYAQEYVNYFLDDEPSPGIAYERLLARQILPSVTAAEVSALARTLVGGSSRVVLAVSPQKPGVRVPSDADLQTAIRLAEGADVARWTDTTPTRGLIERTPDPAAIAERREIPALGVTVVTFANGVEAWLKPTDFKNDQVVFSFDALGGASLAPPADYPEATLATAYVGQSGVAGLRPADLQKLLAGKLAAASPYIGLSTHGVRGGGTPETLETSLQLLYAFFTAPNDDPDALDFLKRQLSARAANRDQSPQQVFADRLAQVDSSNHYAAQPLTPERVSTLDRAKMAAFYRQRFSNAADFTFAMVGAFTVDEAVPMLARYVGSLPSTGQPASKYNDVQIHFPAATERVLVQRGRDPRSQSVISFFADPPLVPEEQEQVAAANLVLETVLRDILREQLGQTYSVSVGLAQPLPQRGAGHIDIRFTSAPENRASMTDRVLAEVKRLQDQTVSADLVGRAKEAARRSYETSLRENAYWLNRLSTIRLLGGDPGDILTRGGRIDRVTPETIQRVFKEYLPLDRYTIVALDPAPAQ